MLFRSKNPDITMASGGSIPKREDNLAQFLKDSKVQQRLYHGTEHSFSVFDKKHHGSKDHGWYGIGHYLTADPETASAYATYNELKDGSAPTGANVMPLWVQLKNPYHWPEDRKVAQTKQEAQKVTDELMKAGYDGVVVSNKYQHPDYMQHHEVVAFHPHQIKSAIGNRGTYDPKNPDITMAKGGEVPSLDAMKYALTQRGGMHSPLEKAAINVPRTKGTPAEFLAEASKQPG